MVGKMQELGIWLREHDSCVLCFSGGLDSTALLCNCASYIPGRFVIVFAELPMTTERQKMTAIKTASELHCDIHIIRISEGELKDMMRNDQDRCYHCKKAIYSHIRKFADDNGYRYILSGDNYDDLSDDRPGRKAGNELGVLAPLEILCIGRKEVEEYISKKGFDLVKDTCMATRYPQGTPLTEDVFRYAEKCETAVRNISGLRQLRVRIDGRSMTVQTSAEEMPHMMSKRTDITEVLNTFGADKVTLSEDPYRTV